MSSKLHTRRPKHKKLMNLAVADIKTSEYHKRESNYYLHKGQQSVEYMDASRAEALAGWASVTSAIDHVVECGCPSSLWPEEIRDVISV